MTGDRALKRAAAVEATIGAVFRLLQKLTALSIAVIAFDLGVSATLVGAGIAVQSAVSTLTIVAQLRHPRVVSNRTAMIGSLAAMLFGTLIVAGSGAVGGPLGAVLFVAGLAVSGCAFTLNNVFRRRTAARFPGRESDFNVLIYRWGLAVELIGGIALTALSAWRGWPVAMLTLAVTVAVVGFMAWRSRRRTSEPPPAQPNDLTRDSLMPSVRAMALAALAVYAIAQLSSVLYGPTLAEANVPFNAPLGLAVAEAAIRVALLPITGRRGRRSGTSPRRVVRPGAAMLLAAFAFAVAAYQLHEVWWLTSVALLGWMALVEVGVVPVTTAIHSGMARTGERATQISALATSAGFALGAGGPWLCEQLAAVWELLAAALADPGMRPLLMLGALGAALFAVPRIARYLERWHREEVGRRFEIAWRWRDGDVEFRIGDGDDWAPFAMFEYPSADVPRDPAKKRSERFVVFRLERVERRRRPRRPQPRAGRLREATAARPRRWIRVHLGGTKWAYLMVRDPGAPAYKIKHRDDGTIVLSIERDSDVTATWRFHRSIDHGDRWDRPTGKRSHSSKGRRRHKRRSIDARWLRALGIGTALLAGAVLVGFGAAYAATLPALSTLATHPVVQAVALAFAASLALGAITWGMVVKHARARAMLALVAVGALALFAVLIGDVALALGAAVCSLTLAWASNARRPPSGGA